MNTQTPLPDDRLARRNVAVLVLAQAILGAQMPILFIIGGLVGQKLAPSPCFATLPITMIVLGSMMSATPVSALMQKHGRRAGFWTGALFGALGAAVSAYGMYSSSFAIFILGSLMTGTYMSAHGFYRFAAADTASDAFRPKAISFVMAGGLLSAIIGPQLVKMTSDMFVIPFLGSYLIVIVLNVIGSALFFFLSIPKPPAPTVGETRGRSWKELLSTPAIAVAVICAMVSYALMNLVMTSTPLAIVGCGFTSNNAADVVSAHVLAMYAPSFVTGYLITRFGVEKIIGTGLFLLTCAGIVALQGVSLNGFFITLILLGFGWNFGFIGATSLLASQHRPSERGRVQGMNDLLVFGGVTVASFASGNLMNCSGSTAQAGWNAVNIAMLPFLLLAASALIWLVRRNRWAQKL